MAECCTTTTTATSNARRESESSLMRELTRFIGCRVVRGPHWKWSKQDGREILIECFFIVVIRTLTNFLDSQL